MPRVVSADLFAINNNMLDYVPDMEVSDSVEWVIITHKMTRGTHMHVSLECYEEANRWFLGINLCGVRRLFLGTVLYPS